MTKSYVHQDVFKLVEECEKIKQARGKIRC